MSVDYDKVYHRLTRDKIVYKEKIHCPMIMKIMANKGRVSAFCKAVEIVESTFYLWAKTHKAFGLCYEYGKVLAREAWEDEGETLKTQTNPPGVISHEFEHWKMIGWSRFGISKNSRIKLELVPTDTPSQHYSQLLIQASKGDFTASEIKQLMEAVNVGLNTHQVFELQKQIDQLKSDLELMVTNKNGDDTFTDQRATKEN
jgi:hypothetical protein